MMMVIVKVVYMLTIAWGSVGCTVCITVDIDALNDDLL